MFLENQINFSTILTWFSINYSQATRSRFKTWFTWKRYLFPAPEPAALLSMQTAPHCSYSVGPPDHTETLLVPLIISKKTAEWVNVGVTFLFKKIVTSVPFWWQLSPQGYGLFSVCAGVGAGLSSERQEDWNIFKTLKPASTQQSTSYTSFYPPVCFY